MGTDQDLPGLVVTGSWTTVKEQMADLYGQRLAERGYATLTFDFTGFGQSAGSPRDVEDPARKTRDIHAAVGALGQAPGVAGDRLGALGVCASAGYTAANAADDPRVRALGLVAPWLHTPELVKPYYGGDDGVADRIAAGESARRHYEETGEVSYVPAVSETDPSAAMVGPFRYYLDPELGAIPEWSARFAVMAWPGWLRYDALASAPRIAQPVHAIHSRDAAVPEGAEAFVQRLAGPAEIDWTEGGQLDFYHQPRQVDEAVAVMATHFGSTL